MHDGYAQGYWYSDPVGLIPLCAAAGLSVQLSGPIIPFPGNGSMAHPSIHPRPSAFSEIPFCTDKHTHGTVLDGPNMHIAIHM